MNGNSKHNTNDSTTDFNKNKIIWINSSIIYLASFLSIYIPSQFLTYVIAHSIFHIPTKFHHAKIILDAPSTSPLWTYWSVIFVFLATPLFCFIIASWIATYLYKNKNKKGNRTLIKLFFLWGFIHASNMLWGGVLVGIPLIKGIGYIFSWLFYYSPFIFCYIAAIALIINGILLNKTFSGYGYNKDILTQIIPQIKFKIFLILLPFLTINSIFLLCGFPDNTSYERLLLATPLIQIIPMFGFKKLTLKPKRNINFTKKISLFFLIILIILILVLIALLRN